MIHLFHIKNRCKTQLKYTRVRSRNAKTLNFAFNSALELKRSQGSQQPRKSTISRFTFINIVELLSVLDPDRREEYIGFLR